MKKFLSLLVIAFSLLQCEKDDTSTYSSSLIGEWDWFITCGGVVGCLTPTATHSTMKLVLTADSTFSRYLNDTLRSAGRFSTYILISENSTDTTNIINLDSSIQKYHIYHDTLSLSNLTFYYGSGYKRIK
ncbi:MAG: hypothetical protein MUO72_04195 [Bacteroidales bacterium]|nr:hypothetical protein [Bacteroidales bacterium]